MANLYSRYLSFFYPSAIWNIKTNNRDVYLTFDDGPDLDATPFVLDIMAKYQIKASFFCIGKNIIRNNQLFHAIIAEGHTVGNHTFSHLNGFKTSFKKYLEDVEQCQKLYDFKYFRPPYGKITPLQLFKLKNKFDIVMWSALSKDYSPKVTPQDCYQTVVKNASPGSILVFHDSSKAYKNLKGSLESAVVELINRGFNFKAL